MSELAKVKFLSDNKVIEILVDKLGFGSFDNKFFPPGADYLKGCRKARQEGVHFYRGLEGILLFIRSHENFNIDGDGVYPGRRKGPPVSEADLLSLRLRAALIDVPLPTFVYPSEAVKVEADGQEDEDEINEEMDTDEDEESQTQDEEKESEIEGATQEESEATDMQEESQEDTVDAATQDQSPSQDSAYASAKQYDSDEDATKEKSLRKEAIPDTQDAATMSQLQTQAEPQDDDSCDEGNEMLTQLDGQAEAGCIGKPSSKESADGEDSAISSLPGISSLSKSISPITRRRITMVPGESEKWNDSNMEERIEETIREQDESLGSSPFESMICEEYPLNAEQEDPEPLLTQFGAED